jgi:hypothetical protein
METPAWNGLVWSELAGGDIREVVILAFDQAVRHSPEHGDLASVGEGVGDGSLEEMICEVVCQMGGGDSVVEWARIWTGVLGLDPISKFANSAGALAVALAAR